jgi:hypothetical protein
MPSANNPLTRPKCAWYMARPCRSLALLQAQSLPGWASPFVKPRHNLCKAGRGGVPRAKHSL